MSKDKANHTGHFVFWAIFVGTVFIILNISIEPVRNFFFISMFGNYFNPAPSFMVFAISILTVVGIGSAAVFYRNQAIAQTKQAKAMDRQAIAFAGQVKEIEKGRLVQQYSDVLNMFSLDKTPADWSTAILLIVEIAVEHPMEYAEKTLHNLAKIGQTFSSKNRFEKIKVTVARKRNNEAADLKKLEKMKFELNEYDRIIVDIIIAISDIRILIDNNKNINIKKTVILDGFYIRNETLNYKFNIYDGFFKNISFENCDFTSLVFYYGNFHHAQFRNNLIMEFHHCLFTLDNSDQINNFEDSDQFNIFNSYFWHTNRAHKALKNPKTKNLIDNTNLKEIPEDELEAWEKAPAPKWGRPYFDQGDTIELIIPMTH